MRMISAYVSHKLHRHYLWGWILCTVASQIKNRCSSPMLATLSWYSTCMEYLWAVFSFSWSIFLHPETNSTICSMNFALFGGHLKCFRAVVLYLTNAFCLLFMHSISVRNQCTFALNNKTWEIPHRCAPLSFLNLHSLLPFLMRL